jgi:hypothetical protein
VLSLQESVIHGIGVALLVEETVNRCEGPPAVVAHALLDLRSRLDPESHTARIGGSGVSELG